MPACGYQWCRLCGVGGRDFVAEVHYNENGPNRCNWAINQPDVLADRPIEVPGAQVAPRARPCPHQAYSGTLDGLDIVRGAFPGQAVQGAAILGAYEAVPGPLPAPVRAVRVTGDPARDEVVGRCDHFWAEHGQGLARNERICEVCNQLLFRLIWRCTQGCGLRVCLRCRRQLDWAR
jgi:hypothetical protein